MPNPLEDRVPLGVRLNNPGNIEIGPRWKGLSDQQKHHRFATFSHPKWGIRAIAVTLTTYQDKRVARDGSKIDTVREMITRWAPPEDDNPTDNYVEFVQQHLEEHRKRYGGDVNTDSFEDMFPLVKALMRFENGYHPYDDETIAIGLRLAGIEPPPKPLRKSRTVRGATVAAVSTGAQAVVDQVPQIKSALSPFSHIEYVQVILTLLTIAGVAYTIYARVDDSQSGKSL